MSFANFTIQPEQPGDDAAVEELLDAAFGLDRRVKTSYRFREGVPHIQELAFVARHGPELVGTIRFWPVVNAQSVSALLLGPLAVSPRFRGHRCGLALMRHGLSEAKQAGHPLVILVGDEPYYSKVGFSRVPPERLLMPGYVDPERLLYCELNPGALDACEGLMSSLDRSPALAEPGSPEQEQKSRQPEKR